MKNKVVLHCFLSQSKYFYLTYKMTYQHDKQTIALFFILTIYITKLMVSIVSQNKPKLV